MTEASGSTVMLEDYVIGGEKEKTEKFDGGVDNPKCDADGDGTEKVTNVQLRLRPNC